MCDFLQTSRISKKQRLRHQLYFEILKIKKRISSEANSRATLLAIYNSLDLSGFTVVYNQLSMMELKAAARRKSVNTMSFIQQELFPIAIRKFPSYSYNASHLARLTSSCSQRTKLRCGTVRSTKNSGMVGKHHTQFTSGMHPL